MPLTQLFQPDPSRSRGRGEMLRMVAMMGLFFLVVSAVGVLRPVKNSLALDGLGRTDFYKVYLVSAVVVFFVPVINRLADRVPWRRLVPGIALFFTANLLIFRLLYEEGNTAFGLIFYGWYDLFAALLVTQFFVATQLFFDARMARKAYPLVIAGGSLGATLGGGITGFFAQTLGTPNLMLVAATFIAIFAIGLPLVWVDAPPARPTGVRSRGEKLRVAEFGELLRNPQVRLIAGMVLVTILVKQLVDYQFNTLSKEVFEDRDAISSFQGKFNAATQWLPIVVLAALQPMLRRFGVGAAVTLLPAAMVVSGIGLVAFWGIAAVVLAKGSETALRYSAERLGREILYVPVPDRIKLKAKTYIDIAVEKGVGKVGSAFLIIGLLALMDYEKIAWVTAGLSAIWFALALVVRREYVRTLATSIEGRFASVEGAFAPLTDASTRPVLRNALASDDPLRVSFALDLVRKASFRDVGEFRRELKALLDHETPAIRLKALEILAGAPAGGADEEEEVLRRCLTDPDRLVREGAVRALHARTSNPSALMAELLDSPLPRVRAATLACLVRDELNGVGLALARERFAGIRGGDVGAAAVEERIEAGLAAPLLESREDAVAVLSRLLADPDPAVASVALESAGRLRAPELLDAIVDDLDRPTTREAARRALASQGTAALPILTRHLLDPETPAAIRRAIPSALARIPSAKTVEALVRCSLARETDSVLDYRALKALGKLRANHPELVFDGEAARALLEREIAAGERYAAARALLTNGTGASPVMRLMGQALDEARAERRECAFRILGLAHAPDEVYSAWMAVTRGDRRRRGNALEWLENTLGYTLFHRLEPLLHDAGNGANPSEEKDSTTLRDRAMPRELEEEEDAWIAHLAQRVRGEVDSHPYPSIEPERADMDLIEIVFLLQKVDMLKDARSAHLALLASVTEEIDADEGTFLCRAGEPVDALYIVVSGAVKLEGGGAEMRVSDGMSFGMWGLVDGENSLFEATVLESTHLLRLGRDAFFDLLADHPELAFGLLRGLAGRMRTLVA